MLHDLIIIKIISENMMCKQTCLDEIKRTRGRAGNDFLRKEPLKNIFAFILIITLIMRFSEIQSFVFLTSLTGC